jgi:hypothetical protein
VEGIGSGLIDVPVMHLPAELIITKEYLSFA